MESLERSSPQILSAGWGKMRIELLGQGKDFKLWPGGGRNWEWTEHGTDHSRGIQPGDIAELITNGCRIVVLTTGRMKRLKVPQLTVERLESEGIKVVVASTKKGIDRYNAYVAAGEAVGGLFHSTC